MALSKPTITACIDGKEHSWLIVAEEQNDGGQRWEHRWCQKCGALTQVTYNEDGQAIAVLNEDKSHFLLVPKIFGVIIR